MLVIIFIRVTLLQAQYFKFNYVSLLAIMMKIKWSFILLYRPICGIMSRPICGIMSRPICGIMSSVVNNER